MQRGLKLLALFALFPIYLFSYDAYWLKLLHFKDGKSEIDDPKFFLSKKGKIDPKAEFEATIDAIKTDSNISCRYPARVDYIYKNYSYLVEDIPKKECQELDMLLSKISPKRVILIFPTAHINSPASMFGHTFFIIRGDEKSILMSNAINYAANTAEYNGLLFAYYGLTGGYEGKYSTLPYYKKIKEYSNMESRDMWEYELNLTPKESRRLLKHLWEIKDSYSAYYFFTKNCSYNLLWLLDIARDDLNLIDEFNYKAIPIDTIKAINKAGLIKKSNFRASSQRKTKALLKAIDRSNGVIKRAYEAELDVKRLKLKRKKREIKLKTYTKELIRLLAIRSKLPKTPTPPIEKPTNPLRSHKSTRVGFGVGDSGYKFSFKAAFHDIYDIDKGFQKGAYIDFFHLILEKKWDKKLKIERFDFVKINSYAPIDKLFSPISWGVSFGFEDFRDKNYFKLDGEIGKTIEISDWLFFATIKPSLYLKEEAIWGVAPKVGGFRDFDGMKVGFSYEHNFYDDGKELEYSELFGTFSLSSDLSLNLKLEDDSIKKRIDLSLFYYF